MTIDGTTLLLAAAACAAVSFAAVGAFLRHARRSRFLAEPTERSSHTVPTPVGGGVGIAFAVTAGLVVSRFVPGGPDLSLFAPGFVAATLTGFRDDRRALAAGPKMTLIVAAAALGLLAARFGRPEVPFLGPLPLDGFLGLAAALVWTSGFSNAFNFMDGIDGLAGSTAVVTGAAYAVAGWTSGNPDVALLGALVAGGGAGFLPWNLPKARIFMGDAGSLPLGLLIAQTAMLADARGALPFAASVVLLAPYLTDVSFTLFRRWREGKRLSQGHREHLYQRLQRALGSHVLATSCYFAAECGVAALALSWGALGEPGRALSLLLVPAVLLAFAPWIFRAERARADGVQTR